MGAPLRRWGSALGGWLRGKHPHVPGHCGKSGAAEPLKRPSPGGRCPSAHTGADEGNGKKIDHLSPHKALLCGAVRRPLVLTSLPLVPSPKSSAFLGPLERWSRLQPFPSSVWPSASHLPPGEGFPAAYAADGTHPKEKEKRDHPSARRRARRPEDRTTASPCSTNKGRNGRGWSSHRA